ncbi:putative phage tail protein [Methylorubrum extorquens]|nr:putative phage tail protein [Methylorubrum extorquens]
MEDARPHESVSTDFSNVPTDFNEIVGSGGLMGGGGKGGKGSQKSDANNTLRSNAKAKIIEVLGEGEIVGLVNGAKSIYFDQTPLQNASDDSYNFKGVDWEQRTGLPDQEMLTGTATAETTFAVNVEVKSAQQPPVRVIADRNTTAVRIIASIPSLVIQDQNNGSLLPTDLDYVIERRPNGGQWEAVKRELFQQQKTTSPYQKASVIELPDYGFPWSIRVRKINPDANVEWHQNSLVWESYTQIVEGKFTYPNTALVKLVVDAQNFGTSIPSRFFHVKGLIIQVPDNYNPETRTYDGFWQGGFKRAWTNNPAWIFYDLLTNNRYGLGEFIDASKVDKFGLYAIARWCDELVDDGKGGKEPRYTYNGVINSRDDAFKVLQQITTSFRGMAFWSVGQVFAVADMPADYTKILAPANVLGGAFKYSRTAKKTRNSVAMVSWNDPEDYYRPAIEVVQHDEALDRFGWRSTDIQAHGCTSRGMAHRIGRWTLDTEHTATETVEFEMGLDALAKDPIKPGDIIAVADPRKAQTRIGGRVADRDGRRITLDKAFVPLAGSSYRLSVVLASGELETRAIVGWAENNLVAILESDLSGPIVPGAMWAITGTDVAPRQYRVLLVTEPKKNTFKIAALFHDPQKYARVEEGIVLDPIRYTRPKTTIRPVTNIDVREHQTFRNGVPVTETTISWSPANDWLSSAYSVFLAGPDGEQDLGTTTAPSMTLIDLRSGDYTVYVTAVGAGNLRSEATEKAFTIKGWEGLAGPSITNLRVRGGEGGRFSSRDCVLDWDVAWPEGTIPYEIDYVVRVFDLESRELLSDHLSTSATFTYGFDRNVADGGPRRKFWVQVRARDAISRESLPASLVCENPAPEMIIPDVRPTTESVFVSYDRPADLDWMGGLVWLERDQGFDPLKTRPTYDGPNTLINLPVLKDTYYYVRFAAYDAFGKEGLNISPEQRVLVTNKVIDNVAPEIPTGLKLRTISEVSADFTSARVIAEWDANPSPNFASYEIEFKRKQDLSWARDPVLDAKWERSRLPAGEILQVRVRALNTSGYPSGWSEIEEIVLAKNEVPPDPVTKFEAEATFGAVSLSWVDPKQVDLAYVELWAADTVAGERRLIGRAGKGQQSFWDTTLQVSGERFYFARTVNTSDAESKVFVGPARAVAPQITKQEIAAGILDQTSFARGLTLIGTSKGLPPVAGYDGPTIIANEEDGKLYRLTNGKWELVIAEVSVDDIKGLITDEMIAAIDAAKVAGQLSDEQLEAISTNKLIGKVVADQIESLGVNQLIGQLKASQLEAIEATKLIGRLTAAQLEAIEATKLIGKLTAAQIESINAAQLAGQLTAAQLAGIEASKLIGQVVDGQIASVGVGKLAGKITRVQITDGAIASPQIQAGSVHADRLIAYSITAQQIAARAITADQIAVGTLTGNLIAANTITGTNIAARSITAANLVAGTITAGEIMAGAITGDRIAGRTISASNLIAGTITAGEIAARTITGENLAFRSIQAGNIAAGAITAYEVAAYSLTATNIAANQIAAWHIVAGTITSAQIQAGSVHADRLIANSITADQIGANAIRAIHVSASAIEARHIVAYSITAGQIAARTIAAENIAFGTLTGNEIRANSIQADRIVANSITSAQIMAGAIQAAQIAAGAITADKIGVGLGNGNLLFGSDFTNNLGGWVANWWSDGVAPTVSRNGDWAPTGMGSAMVHRPGTPGFGSVADYVLRRRTQTDWVNNYPCVPGRRYELSAYVSVHRCQATVAIQFLNAAGQEVGIAWGNTLETNGANGVLSNWPRSAVFGVAPATAVTMVPICRTTWNGGVDPYTFWTGLYLGNAHANQSAFSPWSPNSSTVIDGGIVATNSLHAEKVIAGTITADKIAAHTITANQIAFYTLTGDYIAANSIYADRIQIGGGNSLTTWLGGPNNTQMNGGYIAANSIAANSLKVGARGLTILGIEFTARKSDSLLSWTSGHIAWVDDNGNQQHTAIAAGSVGWNGWLGVTWFKGRGYLDWSNDGNGGWNRDYAHPDAVPMAFYSGYLGLNVLKGSTIIDGTRIQTGTITANEISAGAIQADKIAAGAIKAEHIGAHQVTADKIGAGTITVSSAIYIGSPRFSLDVPTRMMRVFAPSGTEMVSIGNIGRFWGEGDDGRHGLIIRAPDGNHVMQVDQHGASIAAAYIRDLRVTRAMIDDASINNAKIENGAITSAKIGYLEVDMANIKNGAVSQALAGSWGAGGAQVLGVGVRSHEAKLQIRGIAQNNPNTNWGSRSAGYLHIYFNPDNDGSRRWIIATVAQNFWMDRFLNYYWGTTPIEVVHQPGPGYHSYTIESSTGYAEGMNLSIIELTK